MAAIKEKAILLAEEKSQEMPVIVFCQDIVACQEWKMRFPAADIFAGNDAGDLVALLQNFRQLSKGIVLTTSAACKGADFVFAVPQAFVIHTIVPQNWLQLQQDSGRGVRGHQELPVVGAIFTEGPQNNLEQIKQKLMFADRFDRLFTPDYTAAHSFLVACSASNSIKPAKKYKTSVEMLNAGKDAAEIYKLLYSVKRFRDFLPENAPKASTQLTIVQQQDIVMGEEKANTNMLTPRYEQINIELQGLNIQSSSRQAIKDEVNDVQAPEVSAFWGEPIITENNQQFKIVEDSTQILLGKRGCPEKIQNKANSSTLAPHLEQINVELVELNLQSSSRQFIKDRVNHPQDSEVSAFWDGPIQDKKTIKDAKNALLGKRKQPEHITKAGTLEVSSFFAPKCFQKVSKSVIGSASMLVEANIKELYNQVGLKPSDSISQIGSSDYAESNLPDQEKVESLIVSRKRESKAAIKSSKAISEISRNSTGRFEAKYKVGDRATNGTIIRQVKEEDWELLAQKDNKGNSYFKCIRCNKAQRVLKSDRKKHTCRRV